MSWVFGYWGRKTDDLKNEFENVHSTPLNKVNTDRLYLAAGGLPETCLLHSTDDSRQGLLILGLGIRTGSEGSEILTKEDWIRTTGAGKFLPKIDGHFVVIRWADDGFEVQNDVLGIRTMYLVELAEDKVCFSTRLDWIARITGNGNLDEQAFSSHWLTFSQMSYACLLSGIHRLGPGGKFKAGSTRVAVAHTPWLPDESPDSKARLSDRIRSAVHLTPPPGMDISLGLSGGLDSRLVLSQMLTRSKPFNPHVFGFSDDPDRVIAKKITKDAGIPLRELNLPVPSPDQLLDALKDFVPETNLISPASTWLKIRHFSEIHASGQVLVDGANGEIGRRQFLNRLALSGKKSLRRPDPKAVFGFLRIYRAECFNVEFAKRMQKNTVDQIAEALSLLPEGNAFSEVGNLVDLLAVRYRICNYGGLGQAYTDARVINFVPLSQPSFINLVFRTPLADRRNATLYRSVIARDCPSLTKYPMTKYGVLIPYRFPTIAAWVWARLKAKGGLAFTDPSASMVLYHLKPFVLDSLGSRSFAEYGPYDIKRIRSWADAFYAGDSSMADRLDWWLAFEIWRQSVSVN